VGSPLLLLLLLTPLTPHHLWLWLTTRKLLNPLLLLLLLLLLLVWLLLLLWLLGFACFGGQQGLVSQVKGIPLLHMPGLPLRQLHTSTNTWCWCRWCRPP
jgi:hypothetical protein